MPKIPCEGGGAGGVWAGGCGWGGVGEGGGIESVVFYESIKTQYISDKFRMIASEGLSEV